MSKALSLSAAVWVQLELYTFCLDDAQVAGIVLSCAHHVQLFQSSCSLNNVNFSAAR
jgi:hypothetical protein